MSRASVLLTAVLLAGCGAARQPAHPVTRLAVTGATSSQRALLRRIAAGTSAAHVLGVRVGSPPSGFAEDRPGAVWLYFTLAAPDKAGQVRAEWERDLVTGAFAAKTGAPVAGTSAVVTFADGRTEELASVALGRDSEPEVGEVDPSSVTAALDARSASSGLGIDSVEILRPQRVAVAVNATTGDPAGFARTAGSRTSRLFREYEDARAPTVEGAYLSVRDRSGRVVVASAWSTRVRVGSLWIRPDLRDAG